MFFFLRIVIHCVAVEGGGIHFLVFITSFIESRIDWCVKVNAYVFFSFLFSSTWFSFLCCCFRSFRLFCCLSVCVYVCRAKIAVHSKRQYFKQSPAA